MSAAKPMNPDHRAMAYIKQNGSLLLTPRQSRRYFKKLGRWLRAEGWGESG